MAFLEISQLHKTFPTPKGPLTVVEDFNLNIRKGEFIALIGHSGCGKSTVLSMIAGLADISQGGIVLSSKEVTNAGPDRGSPHSELSLVMSRNDRREVIDRTIARETSGSYQWEAFTRAVRGEKLVDETTPEQIVAGLRVVDQMTKVAISLG